MAWQIKRVELYGSAYGGPDYNETAEVKRLLVNGWEPFCVTTENGVPYIWLKTTLDDI